MKTIPDMVKEHVLKNCGRMPETGEEVDEYLDLINHVKEYEKAFELEQTVSKKFLKKIGIKTTDQIIKEGKILFKAT